MKKWEEKNNFSKNKLHCLMISFLIPFDWVIFCLLKIFSNQPLIVRQVWGVWLCTYFWSQPPTGEFNLCSKPFYTFPLQEWYLCIVHLSRDNKHKIDYGDLSILGWLNTHEFIFCCFFLHNKKQSYTIDKFYIFQSISLFQCVGHSLGAHSCILSRWFPLSGNQWNIMLSRQGTQWKHRDTRGMKMDV